VGYLQHWGAAPPSGFVPETPSTIPPTILPTTTPTALPPPSTALSAASQQLEGARTEVNNTREAAFAKFRQENPNIEGGLDAFNKVFNAAGDNKGAYPEYDAAVAKWQALESGQTLPTDAGPEAPVTQGGIPPEIAEINARLGTNIGTGWSTIQNGKLFILIDGRLHDPDTPEGAAAIQERFTPKPRLAPPPSEPGDDVPRRGGGGERAGAGAAPPFIPTLRDYPDVPGLTFAPGTERDFTGQGLGGGLKAELQEFAPRLLASSNQLTGFAQEQLALGGRLSPSVRREIEQSTRRGQTARGNLYGNASAYAEALALGQAGEEREFRRFGQLGAAIQSRSGLFRDVTGRQTADVAARIEQARAEASISAQQRGLSVAEQRAAADIAEQQFRIGITGVTTRADIEARERAIILAEQSGRADIAAQLRSLNIAEQRAAGDISTQQRGIFLQEKVGVARIGTEERSISLEEQLGEANIIAQHRGLTLQEFIAEENAEAQRRGITLEEQLGYSGMNRADVITIANLVAQEERLGREDVVLRSGLEAQSQNQLLNVLSSGLSAEDIARTDEERRLAGGLTFLGSGQTTADVVNRERQQDLANAGAFLTGTTPSNQFAGLATGKTGATPYDPGSNQVTSLFASGQQAGQAGAGFAQQTFATGANIYGTQVGSGGITNPWMEGLKIGAAVVGTCWVAREIYGINNPKWLLFRNWLLNKAPNWFRNLYLSYGQRFAYWLKDKPRIKYIIRLWMNTRILEGS